MDVHPDGVLEGGTVGDTEQDEIELQGNEVVLPLFYRPKSEPDGMFFVGTSL